MKICEDVMPTPCPTCGDVVDFRDMKSDPTDDRILICNDCADEFKTIWYKEDEGKSL